MSLFLSCFVFGLIAFNTLTLAAPVSLAKRQDFSSLTVTPDNCSPAQYWGKTYQSNPGACSEAGIALCGQIASNSWSMNAWTTTTSSDGTCQAMVYYGDGMSPPNQNDCINDITLMSTICIQGTPGRNDAAEINANEAMNSLQIGAVAGVPTYQIGATGFFTKVAQMGLVGLSSNSISIASISHE
ncbi:MAG: hypothetical protein M1827_006491 [Pycnora praestabilis]|nr:MAG: hypothetical protein M1827_006491 [Pycnora praestabilis]